MRPCFRVLAACALLACAPPGRAAAQSPLQPPAPGSRVLLDAHNCYPYNGRWADRIDRALSTGTPLAIEQDLVWYRDPATGKGRSLVAHDEYMLLADYAAYVACQEEVGNGYREAATWTRKSILNVARMGKFSTDRTIREYADEIWSVQPVYGTTKAY